MGWLSGAVTVIGQFAVKHGTVAALIAAAMIVLAVALTKLFESLPRITESVYKRRPAILAAKVEIKATTAQGKVDKIRALTDRKASQARLKAQHRVLHGTKINSTDDAVKLIRAIQADPNLPEKRRLPDTILGEIYTQGEESSADTPPDVGPSTNIRRLGKPGQKDERRRRSPRNPSQP